MISKDFTFADPILDRHLAALFSQINQDKGEAIEDQDYIEEITNTSGLVTSITFWDKNHKQIMKTYTFSYTSNLLTAVSVGIYSDGKLTRTDSYSVSYSSNQVSSITRTKGT